jgi:hypothetical protein
MLREATPECAELQVAEPWRVKPSTARRNPVDFSWMNAPSIAASHSHNQVSILQNEGLRACQTEPTTLEQPFPPHVRQSSKGHCKE